MKNRYSGREMVAIFVMLGPSSIEEEKMVRKRYSKEEQSASEIR